MVVDNCVHLLACFKWVLYTNTEVKTMLRERCSEREWGKERHREFETETEREANIERDRVRGRESVVRSVAVVNKGARQPSDRLLAQRAKQHRDSLFSPVLISTSWVTYPPPPSRLTNIATRKAQQCVCGCVYLCLGDRTVGREKERGESSTHRLTDGMRPDVHTTWSALSGAF